MSPQTYRLLACVLVFSAIVFAFVGCDRLHGKPTEAAPTVIGSPSWTQSTFNTSCLGCHSKGAEGAAIPLMNAGYWKVATDAHVIQVLSHGQGVSMPNYLDSDGGPLTSDEIAALVKVMRSMWGAGSLGGQGAQGGHAGQGDISATVVAGDAASGAKVFATACASCHGTGGSAGSVTDPMYLRLISDQGLWSAVVYGRTELGSPAWNQPMPNHPTGLTTTEVADVVSWIAQARPVSKAQGQAKVQTKSQPKNQNASDTK